MGEGKRFDIFFEKHFGLGIRWDSWSYPFELSVAIPFVTITIGFGKRILAERDKAESKLRELAEAVESGVDGPHMHPRIHAALEAAKE